MRFLCSAGIALLAAGCKDGAPGHPSSELDPVRDAAILAREFATEEQLPALDDGLVTADEYEAAILATVRCMEDAGIVFVEPARWDEETGSRVEFQFKSEGGREGADAANRIYDQCARRFSSAIEYVWVAQTTVDEQTTQAARQAFGACLRDAGLDVPAQPSAADFATFSQVEAFWPCARQIETEYGIRGFAG